MSMPEDYRSKFVAQLHNALSGFTGLDVDEAVRYLIGRQTNTHKYTTDDWWCVGTPNRANQKPSALQSKQDLIIVFVRISVKCYVMAVHVSRLVYSLCTKMSPEIQIVGTPSGRYQSLSTSQKMLASKSWHI